MANINLPPLPPPGANPEAPPRQHNLTRADIHLVDGQCKFAYQGYYYSVKLKESDSKTSAMQRLDRLDSPEAQRQIDLVLAAGDAFIEAMGEHGIDEHFQKATISNTNRKISVITNNPDAAGDQPRTNTREVLFSTLPADIQTNLPKTFKGALSVRFQRPAGFNEGSSALSSVLQATRGLKHYREFFRSKYNERPIDGDLDKNRLEYQVGRIYNDIEGANLIVPAAHINGGPGGDLGLRGVMGAPLPPDAAALIDNITGDQQPMVFQNKDGAGRIERTANLSYLDIALTPKDMALQNALDASLAVKGSPGVHRGLIRRPPVFAVKLNRTDLGGAQARRHNTKIDLELDLQPLVYDSQRDDANPNEFKYELSSFVWAENTANGPYKAYVKEGGQWFECDGPRVVRISENRAKEQLDKAYLCFYEPVVPLPEAPRQHDPNLPPLEDLGDLFGDDPPIEEIN